MPSPVNLQPHAYRYAQRQSDSYRQCPPQSANGFTDRDGHLQRLGLEHRTWWFRFGEARRREECQIFALPRGRRDEWYGHAELYRSTQGYNLQSARDRSYRRNPTHGFHSKCYEPGTQPGRTPSNPLPACTLAICLSHDGMDCSSCGSEFKAFGSPIPALPPVAYTDVPLFLRRRRFQRHAEGNIHPNNHGQVGKQKRANAAHTFGTVNWEFVASLADTHCGCK